MPYHRVNWKESLGRANLYLHILADKHMNLCYFTIRTNAYSPDSTVCDAQRGRVGLHCHNKYKS